MSALQSDAQYLENGAFSLEKLYMLREGGARN
jgi:hypothetical protein